MPSDFSAEMLGIWDFQNEALLPKPSDPTVYQDAAGSMITKAAAGFPVSSVDAYGRIISYHFL